MSMLRQAARKIPPAANIRWINSSAEQLPVASGSIDTLICNNSFHYYQRPVLVLREFQRVLRHGGRLILSDWCNDFLTNKVAHIALRLVQQTNLHRYSLKHCYKTEELAALLEEARFRIEDCRTVEMNLGWGVMVYSARA